MIDERKWWDISLDNSTITIYKLRIDLTKPMTPAIINNQPSNLIIVDCMPFALINEGTRYVTNQPSAISIIDPIIFLSS